MRVSSRTELTKRKRMKIQQAHPNEAMHGEHASLLTKRSESSAFELLIVLQITGEMLVCASIILTAVAVALLCHRKALAKLQSAFHSPESLMHRNGLCKE